MVHFITVWKRDQQLEQSWTKIREYINSNWMEQALCVSLTVILMGKASRRITITTTTTTTPMGEGKQKFMHVNVRCSSMTAGLSLGTWLANAFAFCQVQDCKNVTKCDQEAQGQEHGRKSDCQKRRPLAYCEEPLEPHAACPLPQLRNSAWNMRLIYLCDKGWRTYFWKPL